MRHFFSSFLLNFQHSLSIMVTAIRNLTNYNIFIRTFSKRNSTSFECEKFLLKFMKKEFLYSIFVLYKIILMIWVWQGVDTGTQGTVAGSLIVSSLCRECQKYGMVYQIQVESCFKATSYLLCVRFFLVVHSGISGWVFAGFWMKFAIFVDQMHGILCMWNEEFRSDGLWMWTFLLIQNSTCHKIFLDPRKCVQSLACDECFQKNVRFMSGYNYLLWMNRRSEHWTDDGMNEKKANMFIHMTLFFMMIKK